MKLGPFLSSDDIIDIAKKKGFFEVHAYHADASGVRTKCRNLARKGKLIRLTKIGKSIIYKAGPNV